MATPSLVHRQMLAVVVVVESSKVAIHVCGKALSMAPAINEKVDKVRTTSGGPAPI